MSFRTATHLSSQFLVQQAARLTAFIGLLPFVFCLICIGAVDGTEPARVEESADTLDPASEGEAESEDGSTWARNDVSGASVGRHRAIDPKTHAVVACFPRGIVAAAVSEFPPAKRLADLAVYHGSHARIARLLITSVPTRGPTRFS